MKEHLSASELRNFGLVLAGGFTILLALLFHKRISFIMISWPWLLTAILALALISLTVPGVLAPLNRAWMFLGHILGWINTRIILGIIFLLIFTPAAFIFKLLGKDTMQRSFDAGLKSYRAGSKQPSPENLNRPY